MYLAAAVTFDICNSENGFVVRCTGKDLMTKSMHGSAGTTLSKIFLCVFREVTVRNVGSVEYLKVDLTKDVVGPELGRPYSKASRHVLLEERGATKAIPAAWYSCQFPLVPREARGITVRRSFRRLALALNAAVYRELACLSQNELRTLPSIVDLFLFHLELTNPTTTFLLYPSSLVSSSHSLYCSFSSLLQIIVFKFRLHALLQRR